MILRPIERILLAIDRGLVFLGVCILGFMLAIVGAVSMAYNKLKKMLKSLHK